MHRTTSGVLAKESLDDDAISRNNHLVVYRITTRSHIKLQHAIKHGRGERTAPDVVWLTAHGWAAPIRKIHGATIVWIGATSCASRGEDDPTIAIEHPTLACIDDGTTKDRVIIVAGHPPCMDRVPRPRGVKVPIKGVDEDASVCNAVGALAMTEACVQQVAHIIRPHAWNGQR